MPDAGSGRARMATRAGVLAASMVPLLFTLRGHGVGDLPIYFAAARAWIEGRTPYEEIPLEYPPYALLAFAPAALVATSVRQFQVAFGIELALVDAAIRALLLRVGAARRGAWGYAPFLAYAVVAQLHAFWLYKRFDLIPAALTLVAVLAASGGAAGFSGAALAAGVGTKVYPGVLGPTLLAEAWRGRRVPRFLAGLLVASAPLVGLATAWPVLRMFRFHAGRGLQVESLWASILWLFRSWSGVRWVLAPAAYELQGGLAPPTLRVAIVVWILGLGTATLLSLRRPDGPGPGALASRALVPLLALVALGPVFSPQYVLWIAPLAALLLEPGRWRLAVAPLAAAGLTRVVYPSPGYQVGFSPGVTVILVVRNGLLVLGLVLLAWAAFRGERARERLP